MCERAHEKKYFRLSVNIHYAILVPAVSVAGLNHVAILRFSIA